MLNNNNQNNLYNQENNINRRRLFPQDRPRTNNNNNVNTNMKYGPFPNPNANYMNRNSNNLNQNRNININNKPNDELSQAFLIIQRELKKKDNRIFELKRKVQELTKKLDSLTNSNNINISNNNNFSLSKNSQMMTPYKEDPKNIYENNNFYNNNIMEYTNQNRAKSNTRKNNAQTRGFGFEMNNLNYNSDNENIVKRHQGYDNLSRSNDNSVLTYNGVHTNSKKDVKEYLKEVKAKIDPRKFKEFIRNIKLLTSKNEIAPNKETIIENMRILFGNEHLDLFLRFEKIIGAGK